MLHFDVRNLATRIDGDVGNAALAQQLLGRPGDVYPADPVHHLVCRDLHGTVSVAGRNIGSPQQGNQQARGIESIAPAVLQRVVGTLDRAVAGNIFDVVTHPVVYGHRIVIQLILRQVTDGIGELDVRCFCQVLGGWSAGQIEDPRGQGIGSQLYRWKTVRNAVELAELLRGPRRFSYLAGVGRSPGQLVGVRALVTFFQFLRRHQLVQRLHGVALCLQVAGLQNGGESLAQIVELLLIMAYGIQVTPQDFIGQTLLPQLFLGLPKLLHCVLVEFGQQRVELLQAVHFLELQLAQAKKAEHGIQQATLLGKAFGDGFLLLAGELLDPQQRLVKLLLGRSMKDDSIRCLGLLERGLRGHERWVEDCIQQGEHGNPARGPHETATFTKQADQRSATVRR